jgi:hypothetical protein
MQVKPHNPTDATACNSLCDCGHPPSEHSEHTTGYGIDKDSKTHCWSCCAEQDKAQMIKDGKTMLYLTYRHEGKIAFGEYFDGKVGNWPGTLSFPCRIRKGSHNMARTRYDLWFTGPDGKQWHGVQYGENTQIAHCKRVKS